MKLVSRLGDDLMKGLATYKTLCHSRIVLLEDN